MKLNKLKQVCDDAVGLPSEIVEIELVVEQDTENEEVIKVKALRYTSPTGAFLFNLPIGENDPVGWHLEGKLDVNEDNIYMVFQRAYRSARMTEVAEIQRSRGQTQAAAVEQGLLERINKLEGALRVARTWMGREIEDDPSCDSADAFERDASFVEQVLENPDYAVPPVRTTKRDFV